MGGTSSIPIIIHSVPSPYLFFPVTLDSLCLPASNLPLLTLTVLGTLIVAKTSPKLRVQMNKSQSADHDGQPNSALLPHSSSAVQTFHLNSMKPEDNVITCPQRLIQAVEHRKSRSESDSVGGRIGCHGVDGMPLPHSNSLHSRAEPVTPVIVIQDGSSELPEGVPRRTPHEHHVNDPHNLPTIPPAKPKFSLSRRAMAPYQFRRTSGAIDCKNKIRAKQNNRSSNGLGHWLRCDKNLHPLPTPPLRPPISQRSSGPQYHHAINIETPFTQSTADQTVMPGETRCLCYISCKTLLIMPFTRLRKLSKTRPSSDNKYETLSMELNLRAPDHGSSKKHLPVAQALQQVSALLSSMAGDQTTKLSRTSTTKGVNLSNVRSMSARTDSTRGSRNASKTRTFFGLLSPLTVNLNRSMEMVDTASFTSSILKMKRGPTPNVTPDEGATYRVRQSSSAETEEYLKIDISIRGGTSYLPSEARRIHTPPLPEEDSGSNRRGYFFDYYGPRNELENVGRKGKRKVNSRLQRSSTHPCPRRTAMAKSNCRDWYDVQLAELESSSTSSKGNDDEARRCGRGGRGAYPPDEVDYSIPEHLPTSPLCPRHPRYWRVIQRKGSQFRGCWMHGVGVDPTMGKRQIANFK